MQFENIKFLALFAEGVLSFFSPCVLPILPVYVSLLAGQVSQEAGIKTYRRTVLRNTLSFVVGVALTFFLLAFASSFISRYLYRHSDVLQTLSGLLIILMGAFQLGLLKLPFLNRELSAKNRVYKPGQVMSPLVALLMGFTFSFSWTPCIGPILASVFLYASSHQGLDVVLLIGLYCLGFLLPFVLLGLFSQRLLTFVKEKSGFLKYSKLISGVLLILIGLSILTGFFGNIVKLIR